MSTAAAPELVKFGEGLDVEQIALGTVRRDMQAGTYAVDEEARSLVTTALAAIEDPAVPDPPAECLKDIIHHPRNKELRNAMTSFAIERAWRSYADTVTAGGFYAIAFDETGKSSLHPVEGHQKLSVAGIASLMGASNQDTLTHFLCKQFEGGTPLVISGSPDIDAQYFDAYKEQALLDIHATSNFRTIPLTAGPPSVFASSGAVGLRTHVYGLPNLISHRSSERGFGLSNERHRAAFERTVRTVLGPQWLPTTTVALATSMPLANREYTGLDTDKWTDNGDPENFIVYPRPDVIHAANAALLARHTPTPKNPEEAPERLPAETHCPAFHARVESQESPGRTVPLPRGVLELALTQLDRDYYPRRSA